MILSQGDQCIGSIYFIFKKWRTQAKAFMQIPIDVK